MSRIGLLRSCIRKRHWKGVRFILKSVVVGTLWPFCRTCGKFGFKTRRCCWKCSVENIFRALVDAPPEVRP